MREGMRSWVQVWVRGWEEVMVQSPQAVVMPEVHQAEGRALAAECRVWSG